MPRIKKSSTATNETIKGILGIVGGYVIILIAQKVFTTSETSIAHGYFTPNNIIAMVKVVKAFGGIIIIAGIVIIFKQFLKSK